MTEELDKPDNPLNPLRQFTEARIGLGHAGVSIPMRQELSFKLAHAHARDAVYSQLDVDKLQLELAPLQLPILTAHSRAKSRHQYLQRPDLGRKLSEQSKHLLAEYNDGYDICVVIADGLSAAAVNQHSTQLLALLIPHLVDNGLKISPLVLVEQGRVALADEIAFELKAQLSIIFIGERPGLSSADSMGMYLTYQPEPGLTDDSRNCISNIRPGGMDFKTASQKIFYLVQEAFKLKLSGVMLKDNAGLLT